MQRHRRRVRGQRAYAAVLAVVVAVAVVAISYRSLHHQGPTNSFEQATPVRFGERTTSIAAPTGTPVWADDFTGPVGYAPSDTSWRPELGGKGFGNQQLECSADDRSVSALDGRGHLVLTARYEPGYRCSDGSVNDYVSARISTSSLRDVRYGRIRVRAQMPSATGAWPAIWALGQDIDSVGYPASGEIDVAEVVGSSPNNVYQTLHGPGEQGDQYVRQAVTELDQPASAAFHVYGVDWNADSLTFSLDDRVTGRFTRAEVEKSGRWVFDKQFYLLLGLAVGGDFPGDPDSPAPYPQRMVIDYVRVYAA